MTDDLISRKAAIGIAHDLRDCISVDGYWAWTERLKKLPSAQPERPTGHWIVYVISPFDGEDAKCSECGRRGCAPYWDYCPGCGAKMEGAKMEGVE